MVIFLAHPVGAPTREGHLANLARAKRWVRWSIDNYPDVAVVANWLYYCEVLDDSNPAHRQRGIAHGIQVLKLCQELWLVGGRVSSGMHAERNVAWGASILVRDLTSLGDEPPAEAPHRISLANYLDPPRLVAAPQ